MNETNDKKFDVVCGMELSPARVEHVSEYEGTKYYFCSGSCKNNFEKDHEKYAASSA